MEKYNQMVEFLKSLQNDFEKFYNKGNKASGTRLRKNMQELKSMAQDIRVEIQSRKKDDEPE
jgi:Histone H1-like protein Hc1